MIKISNYISDFGVSLLAMAFLLAPTSGAWAGKPLNANVIANAECQILVDNDLTVNAILEQKEKIGEPPYVATVTYILQKHVRKGPEWTDLYVVDQGIGASFEFETPAAGETVEVGTYTFMQICSLLDQDANSVRAVVEIEVTNSNPKRNAGQFHTGRCISLSNPCTN